MSDEGRKTWLPLADVLNLLSLAITLIGVFIGPALGLAKVHVARIMSAWAVLLLVGWPPAVVGHYELFGRGARRARRVTRQELVVVTGCRVGGLAGCGRPVGVAPIVR